MALLLVLANESIGAASGPGPLPQSNLMLYTNGYVTAAALAPDGSIVFGGEFTSVNGTPRGNIARLTPDGTLDSAWNPMADNAIFALSVDGDGNVYAGGWFTNIGGQQRSGIAKLSGYGSGQADPDWAPKISGNGSVYALALDGEGSLFAGGNFSSINGESFVTKLATSGSGISDAPWSAAANDAVTALAMGPEHTLFVGGNFTAIGGQARAGIAKLASVGSGAADPDWNPGVDGTVRTLAVTSDGSVFAGGYFLNAGGASHPHLVKLAGSGIGAPDATWNVTADGNVYVLTLDATGNLYAGGDFYSIGGQYRRGVARLRTAGSGAADASWNVAADNDVAAIVATNDGRISLGGYFTRIAGQDRRGFALLSSDAAVLPALDVELPGTIGALAKQADGGVIAGGLFFRAGPYIRHNLLRIQPDGNLDTDWAPTTDNEVMSLAIGNDGSIFVGGDFSTVNGQSTGSIAKLQADQSGSISPWSSPGFYGEVHSLVLDETGALYAGGLFSRIYGGPDNLTLAKFNAAYGYYDASWSPTSDGVVLSLALGESGNSLFVGGFFMHVDNELRQGLAKVDASSGALDTAWTPQTDSEVDAMVVDGKGSIYVGGEFHNIGGVTQPYLARLSTTGSGIVDPTWTPTLTGNYYNTGLQAMALDSLGGLVIGGRFDNVSGVSRANLARISTAGSGTPDPTWDPQIGGSLFPPLVQALAFDSRANAYVGGQFVSVANQPRNGIAAIPLDSIFANSFE